MIETITLKDDHIFLVSDTAGELKEGWAGHGLYFEDTRYLSRLELSLNGQPAQALNYNADYNIAATFHLSSPYQTQLENQADNASPAQTAVAHAVGVVRRRLVKDGLCEQLEFTNFHPTPLTVAVSLTINADFADIFEVRGFPRHLEGEAAQVEIADGGQRLAFRSVPVKETLATRHMTFETSRRPDQYEQRTVTSHINKLRLPEVVLHYKLDLAPGQPLTLNLTVQPLADGETSRPQKMVFMEQVAHTHLLFEDWQAACTQVQSDDYLFNQVMRISSLDLRSLMQKDGQRLIVTAGLPWYFSLFGRDSLVAAMQSLSLNPQIAIDTLRALAAHQGTQLDDWRDEEPGKILHELRRGDMTLSGEMPHGPYYGSVDSTLLFIWCFARTLAWTDDAAFFAELWPAVERALAWASDYGDPTGTGYITFSRRSKRGILHQGWKDSDESMGGSLGPRPQPPLALVEVQGYYYAALTEVARTLKRFGDAGQRERAVGLETQAAELKTRFNRDFWWEEAGFFAQALDGQGQQVRNITSNPGHCLWSGIIEDEKAARVVARLMQADMLSGWGIRTISTTDPTYNPMSYHNGSIWPHDNSLIAAGFRRYGFDQETLTLIGQLLQAANTFPGGRLPELYCGFPRFDKGIEERGPAAYPVSCSPQAWAAGSGPLILQTLLGLEADAANNTLEVKPLLPTGLNELTLHGLRVGQQRTDLAFKRDSAAGRVATHTSQSTINLSQTF